MGVDGFRLDAIPYLVEEDGKLLHTVGTHKVLREFAAYVRTIAPNAFTIGEVWDSTGAMLPYYPGPARCALCIRHIERNHRSCAHGFGKKLLAPVLRLQSALPANRWAPFLRNHDQTRTITDLGGSVERAKLAATILLTLPGAPFVYYGEEIGMSGNKPDERLRTPMQWNQTRAGGFTRGAAWQPLQPDSAIANVKTQEGDPGSLLTLYRRLIHLRTENSALAKGDLVPLTASNDMVAAYLRRDRNRRDNANNVLVVINFSATALLE